MKQPKEANGRRKERGSFRLGPRSPANPRGLQSGSQGLFLLRGQGQDGCCGQGLHPMLLMRNIFQMNVGAPGTHSDQHAFLLLKPTVNFPSDSLPNPHRLGACCSGRSWVPQSTMETSHGGCETGPCQRVCAQTRRGTPRPLQMLYSIPEGSTLSHPILHPSPRPPPPPAHTAPRTPPSGGVSPNSVRAPLLWTPAPWLQ